MNYSLFLIGVILSAWITFNLLRFRKMKRTHAINSSKNISELTDANFTYQVKDGLTLVDFWAEWCMPCKMMAPVLNDLADDPENQAKIAKLNVEHHQNMASILNVRNIPTLILFYNGKEVNRFVGIKSKEFLKKEIRKVG